MVNEVSSSTVQEYRDKLLRTKNEIQKVILGMEEQIETLMLGFISGGHILIEGLPGLAKTKLFKAGARVCGLEFKRIQGKADLTPDDIMGYYLPDPESEKIRLKFYKGPIFGGFVVCDEINRATPKAQAGLLEGMQEFRITTAYGEEFRLPKPFFLLATQNPMEVGAGVFPLTNANLDRFMFMTRVQYPSEEDEIDVVGQDDTEPSVSNLKSQLTGEDILALWTLTKSLYPLRDARQMNQYLVRLCRATRPIDGEEKKVFSIYGLSSHDDGNRGEKIFFGDIVETGVSTRAQKFLARAARAYAFYKGAKFLTPQHVKAVAHRVLRHRIVLTHQAESIYKITTDNVIDYLLSNVSETDVR